MMKTNELIQYEKMLPKLIFKRKKIQRDMANGNMYLKYVHQFYDDTRAEWCFCN